MTKDDFKELLERVKGSTIALVYIFEGESAPGFSHYHIWQGDVISGWLEAVQSLHCRPFLLDVRTFVEKGVSGTLPHIDYVLNLNCGSKELSPMGLVPSTCAFLGIPCIPCDTTGIIVGENKRLSNIIARDMGLSVPKELEQDSEDGIFRPLNFGSSYGVRRGARKNSLEDGVYQEFIPGYDITTPYVFDPLANCFRPLPTILYDPDSKDPNWYFGEEQKRNKTGYQRRIIHGVTDDLDRMYQELISTFNVHTFCRIDARIRNRSNTSIEELTAKPLGLDDLVFIEINTMPTVNGDNSFCHSFNSINEQDSIYHSIELIKQFIGTVSPACYLLACSMIALLKAKC